MCCAVVMVLLLINKVIIIFMNLYSNTFCEHLLQFSLTIVNCFCLATTIMLLIILRVQDLEFGRASLLQCSVIVSQVK